MWMEKVQWVIMAADGYRIMTREDSEPEGKTWKGSATLGHWRKQRNNAPGIILMGFWDKMLPHIKNSVDLAEMWNILHVFFDNRHYKSGRAQILSNMHACQPAKEKNMNIYFMCLIDCRNQLTDSAQVIIDDSFATHLWTHIRKGFGTTINFLEWQALSPVSQHVINCILFGQSEGCLHDRNCRCLDLRCPVFLTWRLSW